MQEHRFKGVLPRAVLTERAKDEIFRQLGAQVRPTIEIAREFGVHWGTAWAAFASRAQPLIDDPDRTGGVEALEAYRSGLKPRLALAAVVADPSPIVRVRREAPSIRWRVRDPPRRAVAAVR